ncbi:MAG TPA: NAD(P)/FAD-dependent oxidoreductase [Pyrinomonadaceae bacterium]|nr:NAD(P)/FAD-dependent oxidoreductase [Pyrinomonadaceae bacterium]
MTTHSLNTFDVAIAGAGPAGTSAAIRLALHGARVLLLEEKKFPRAKLCGEFISPECLGHFQQLGVIDQMIAAGATSLGETVFYSARGHQVAVPSEWFTSGATALGLSRSEMDQRLLERAKAAGVVVLENAHATGPLLEDDSVCGVHVKTSAGTNDYRARITIDATGRSRTLARHFDRDQRSRSSKQKRGLVAFKAHLENTRVTPGACEIYFYVGGYGGLSEIEHGLSNLCFIVSASEVRRCGSDPDRVLQEVVMQNSRAAETLCEARLRSPWLSVSLEGFGRKTLAPANGLLTIGDAASFIDPFTGSGMLMALESGEVVAETIVSRPGILRDAQTAELIAKEYERQYTSRFESRLRVSGLLRRAAFVPYLAETAILLFGASTRLRRRLARATRHANQQKARASLS